MIKRPRFTIKIYDQCVGPDYDTPVLAFDTEEYYYLPLPNRIRGGLKKVSREKPDRIILMFSLGEETAFYVADEICLGINDFFAQGRGATINDVEIVVNDRRIQALIEERMTIN